MAAPSGVPACAHWEDAVVVLGPPGWVSPAQPVPHLMSCCVWALSFVLPVPARAQSHTRLPNCAGTHALESLQEPEGCKQPNPSPRSSQTAHPERLTWAAIQASLVLPALQQKPLGRSVPIPGCAVLGTHAGITGSVWGSLREGASPWARCVCCCDQGLRAVSLSPQP